ncbi:acyltransferase [Oleidesulfovibrio sp.]|uniref:acyltransferase n=1 Tax=Oleidesulfovibrio sp. TaxID=2909707 RepID=UPI003A8C56F6
MMNAISRALFDFFDRRIVAQYQQYKKEQLFNELKGVGQNSTVVYPWDIRGAEHITLRDNVFIGPRVLMGAAPGGEIEFEDYAMLGPNVHIMAGDHAFKNSDGPVVLQGGGTVGKIVFGAGCWVGANCCILKGTTIGAGSVVGAGSIVTKSIPSGEVWAGNPAVFIRVR